MSMNIRWEGYPREMIFQNEEGFIPANLSGDGRYLLVQPITANNNNLFVHDLQTGERMNITPHDGDVNSGPSDYSPDNRYLYYTTNEGSEFQKLMRYELASGEKEEVLAMDWDIYYGVFSREGSYFMVGANVDARTELHMFDAETMQEIDAPDLDGVNVTSVRFSEGDELIAMYGSGSRFPSDLFVQEVGSDSAPRRLTNSLNENINPEHLVQAEVVRFESYDGLEIPGILWTPHDASTDNREARLVWVHGAPAARPAPPTPADPVPGGTATWSTASTTAAAPATARPSSLWTTSATAKPTSATW